MNCSAIVLCGGLGRRVGGVDKGRLPWGGSTLVENVLARIAPQVDDIVISANRSRDWYEGLGYPVIADRRPGFQGPLAGLEAALPVCRHALTLVVCCDTPDLPDDLLERLVGPLEDPSVDVCFASDGERDHYLVAVLRTSLRASLTRYLDGDRRSVRGWYAELHCATADFSAQPSALRNINRPGNPPETKSPR
jgi:molybdopterin-guanine dinucleotide biosynthesis protein A